MLSKVQVRAEEDVEAVEEQRRTHGQMQYQHAEMNAMSAEEDGAGDADEAHPFVRDERKIGRNEPCPCGSGKKYKNCHGRLS